MDTLYVGTGTAILKKCNIVKDEQDHLNIVLTINNEEICFNEATQVHMNNLLKVFGKDSLNEIVDIPIRTFVEKEHESATTCIIGIGNFIKDKWILSGGDVLDVLTLKACASFYCDGFDMKVILV